MEQSSQVLDNHFEKEETSSLPDGQESVNSGISDAEEKEAGYSILVYTEAPNKNSSVSIQYPFFEGEGKERLNDLILAKVQEFARVDDSLFPADAGLTIDYQVEIILQNAEIVSMVFWGTSATGGGAYGTNDVIPFNIDMQTMEEVLFEDLYDANGDFQKVFFEKAYFPTSPITSHDEGSFAEMLRLQSPEYQPVSPFSIPGNVSCFLKPDALVLVMPAVHAAGNDYFEAQINYEDIEAFYLLEQKDSNKTDLGFKENDMFAADDQFMEVIDRSRIDDQSFEVVLNEWGKVTFVSCMPDFYAENLDPLTDASFYLLKNEKVLYRFPYVSDHNIRETGLCEGVSFVFFEDIDEDNKKEIVIGVLYVSGAGPQGMIPYTEIRIYEDGGNEFVYNGKLSGEMNEKLTDEVTADYVKALLKE
ncbi:MAG: hypothetical protein NC123_19545 [Butyrivibrio sp.]|nr:hypothetical protein [Butyrivibrio sp.]